VAGLDSTSPTSIALGCDNLGSTREDGDVRDKISPVPVRFIDHVQLAMPAGGEDAAREFYEGLLGLPERPKPPHLAARGGCWFETTTVKVHLGVDADFHPARKAHPAFLVEDLGELVERFRAAQVELVDDEPLEGYDRVYAYDPFGNRLELLEPTSS
jgi:catechol 2,3-dioxygenase-like lactoylglutathione lyase family enzyme